MHTPHDIRTIYRPQQHAAMWQQIRQQPTNKQQGDKFKLMIQQSKAKHGPWKPVYTGTSRRKTKSQGSATGMMGLKSGSIKNEVRLEVVFVNERYTHRLSQCPKITMNKREITQQNERIQHRLE